MRTDERAHVEVHTGDNDDALELKPAHRVSAKDDIDQSLRAIDADSNEGAKKKKSRRKKRRLAKMAGLVIGLIALVGLGFLGFKLWELGSKVFQGNLMGIFQQKELKMDEFGRSNVLILGSTDDMEGRDGASLTDSMMVVSVDQKKKDAYMFSIPRDLWVRYGQACFTGYEGKINAFYMCTGEGGGQEAEAARMDATRKLVGEIFDMDIQYAVHVNTVVIRDGVDAVGGITVNVESDDDRGVLDSTFDELCRNSPNLCPRGHFMDFPNGPNEMNGGQAMAFSQARGMGARTYGLSGSNFAREKNQQLVLMALKDKAASTGTLTDITKVMGLMQAMGDNLRTNVSPEEVQTIMRLGADIQTGDIHRLSFIEEDNRLMTTGSVGGQSVVQPVAGLYNYSEVRSFLKRTVYATPLTKEGARIAVLNGSSIPGRAQQQADELTQLGMNVVLVGNAPVGEYAPYTVYSTDANLNMPLTREKLEQLHAAQTQNEPVPFGVSTEADYVLIIGRSSQ